MDEDDAPAVSLSRSKAAKAEATQDRAPTRYRKLQARHIRRNALRDAAKQKRDATAQSEGEQMEDGEAEPQQACQLWLLMELVRELQTPTQRATTTQEIYSRETEEEQPNMEVTETAAEPEMEQEEADQMRDTDTGSAAAAAPSAAYSGFEPPPGWEQWSMEKKKDLQTAPTRQAKKMGGGRTGTPGVRPTHL